MSIKPLPGDVVAQIKSSVAVTSLNRVVCGLIENSLDARAAKINVSVDYSRGNCSVEDDGHGIQPAEFSHEGGLGQLHCTSKYPPRPDVHGTDGVFLASVAALSLLCVASHHRDFHSHNSKTIHNSKVLTRHTPCPPQQRVLAFSHGTRVTVRDLFGCMPVRVKHRALQADKSSLTREWDRLIIEVVAMLLAWPGTVSVAIRETSGPQKVTLKSNSQSRKDVDNGCQLLYQASLCETPSSSEWVAVAASAPMLSISGYVCREPVATKSVQFLAFGIEPLSNHVHSNILYEEINKVFADSSFGVIEDESDQNRLAEPPSAAGFPGRDFKAKKGLDRWPMFFLQINATSASQTCLKTDDILNDCQPSLNLIIDLLKAMFHEFLKKNHCRPRTINLSTKSLARPSRSQSSAVTPGLEASMASSSATRHSTINTNSTLPSASPTVGPRDRSASRRGTPDDRPGSRPPSPFATWSKVKSGHVIQNFKITSVPGTKPPSLCARPADDNDHGIQSLETIVPPRSVVAKNSRPSLYDANGRLTRKPFDNLEMHSQEGSQKTSSTNSKVNEPTTLLTDEVAQDNLIECVNPYTQMAVSVNCRTGFSSTSRSLTLSKRASDEKGARLDCESVNNSKPPLSTQPWVTELVGKWKNPVFELTEEPILRLPDVSEMLPHVIRSFGQHGACGSGSVNMGTRFETSSLALKGRVSKQTLRKAELIAQVDHKFILAKMPLNHVQTQPEDRADGSSTSIGLFLIDQHAADERCRVEELMAGFFTRIADSTGKLYWHVDTESLPQSVHFELSRQEEGILQRTRQYFSYWGIVYDVETVKRAASPQREPGKSHGQVRLAVSRLPPAIIERCRTEPRLLAELIRKEAWRLNDEGRILRQPTVKPVLAGEVEGGVPAWVSLLHECPPGILDLINSRSCRSE